MSCADLLINMPHVAGVGVAAIVCSVWQLFPLAVALPSWSWDTLQTVRQCAHITAILHMLPCTAL